MDRPLPAAPIAACFALSGFAVAIIAGLSADRAASSVLMGAMFALGGCYVVGLAVAHAAAVALRERLEQTALAPDRASSPSAGTNGPAVT